MPEHTGAAEVLGCTCSGPWDQDGRCDECGQVNIDLACALSQSAATPVFRLRELVIAQLGNRLWPGEIVSTFHLDCEYAVLTNAGCFRVPAGKIRRTA